jgi:cytochrome c553
MLSIPLLRLSTKRYLPDDNISKNAYIRWARARIYILMLFVRLNKYISFGLQTLKGDNVKKSFLRVLVILIFSGLLLSACSGDTSQSADDDHADTEHMDEEHEDGDDHAHVDAPHEYDDLSNPFGDDDQESIEAGDAIYETNCATCHGPNGEGNGPGAEGLDPKPASLADAHMMEELSDGYLFWRVSEGGAHDPFNSAMPAWKDVLSENERWQVISFVRSLSEDEH